MQALNKPCQNCHKPMNGGVYRANHICPHCAFEHEGGRRSRASHAPALDHGVIDTPVAAEYEEQQAPEAEQAVEVERIEPTVEAKEPTPQPAPVVAKPTPQSAPVAAKPTPAATNQNLPLVDDDTIVLTTKSYKEQTVVALMDEVTAESVRTIPLTPDMFLNGKFIGQKSAVVVAALKQGKLNALEQLRQAAYRLDANMVTDVSVKNGIKMVDKETANVIVSAVGSAIVAEMDECEA